MIRQFSYHSAQSKRLFFVPNTGPLIVHEYNEEERGEKTNKQQSREQNSSKPPNSHVYIYLIFSVLAAQVSLGPGAASANHGAQRLSAVHCRQDHPAPGEFYSSLCIFISVATQKPQEMISRTGELWLAACPGSACNDAQTRRISHQKKKKMIRPLKWNSGGHEELCSLGANQCVSVSAPDRNCLCPEAFHMVTEANLSVLLWLNQPFLIANTALFESC